MMDALFLALLGGCFVVVYNISCDNLEYLFWDKTIKSRKVILLTIICELLCVFAWLMILVLLQLKVMEWGYI